MKTFSFKLYKSERNEKLHKQINSFGLVYNHCIALHRKYYKIFGKYLKRNFLQKHLFKLKKLPKFNFLCGLNSQAIQDVTDRIDRAFQLFFRNVKRKIRCSPPNFKKIKNYKSFTLKQSGWKFDEKNKILQVGGQNSNIFSRGKFREK